MTEIKTKTVAVFAVFAILCASCAGFAVTDTEEEPDGIAPLVVLGLAALSGGSFAGGWFAHDFFDSDNTDVQPYLRLDTARNVTDIMSVATAFTANSNSNYAQLWSMTKEHWIRQAELEAYTEWESGKTYDGNSVLEGARAFENNSVMTANAVAQFNSLFDQLSDKVSKWSGMDTYKNKMSVGFILDNNSILSKSGVNADLISVSVGMGQIYIGTIQDGYVVTADTTVSEDGTAYVPGYIYSFGAQNVITAEDGTSYLLKQGKNYLSDLRSVSGNKAFSAGIYTVGGTLGGDTLAAVVGSDLSLKAGIAMQTGSDISLAYLDGDKIVGSGESYDRISFKVVPDDTPSGEDNRKPDAVEITSVLKAYQTLLDKLYWTTVTANNSAAAVWNIYDRMDAKNYSVTSLMNSNVYNTSVLSTAMNEVLTLSAMQQLSETFTANGEKLDTVPIGLYATGMDAPFVRGNILDEFGNTVYSDVIFTPFFQSDSVVLERGMDHTVTQNCLVAVWASGQELVSWYAGGMSAEGYETAMIGEGYTIQITQLATCDDSGMHNEPKISLDVSKVNYISPEHIKLTKDSDYSSATNIMKVICIVAGAILAVLGIVRRSPVSIVAGIGLIVFGAFFADTVFEKIGRLIRI